MLVIPHAKASASRSTVNDKTSNYAPQSTSNPIGSLPSIRSLQLELPEKFSAESTTLPSLSNLNLPFGVPSSGMFTTSPPPVMCIPSPSSPGGHSVANSIGSSLGSSPAAWSDRGSTTPNSAANSGSVGASDTANMVGPNASAPAPGFVVTTPPASVRSAVASNPATRLTPDIDSIEDSAINDTETVKLEVSESAMADALTDLPKTTRKWKPRKKRQCPECKLFFSNLATHKSTHLNPTSRPHVCEHCNRGFARPNDLFRHVKCHWKEIGSDKGQFKCPYKNHSSGDHCGHNSGIFSRCDTFKNHLKAIHFQYPSGTKKDQRAKSSGSCRVCREQFESVDDWLVNHVEKNGCPYANAFKKS